MISRASARPRQRTGWAVKSRDRCVCIIPSLVDENLSQRGGLVTLVHGYANPLTIRRFVKLAESPKVLKMLSYGRIRATRSLPHLTAAEGGKRVAESGGRCHLPGWGRGYREPRSPRRLTPPSPKSPHSSVIRAVHHCVRLCCARNRLGKTPDHLWKARVNAAGSEKSSAAETCTNGMSVSVTKWRATSNRTSSAMVLKPPAPTALRCRFSVRLCRPRCLAISFAEHRPLGNFARSIWRS